MRPCPGLGRTTYVSRPAHAAGGHGMAARWSLRRGKSMKIAVSHPFLSTGPAGRAAARPSRAADGTNAGGGGRSGRRWFRLRRIGPGQVGRLRDGGATHARDTGLHVLDGHPGHHRRRSSPSPDTTASAPLRMISCFCSGLRHSPTPVVLTQGTVVRLVRLGFQVGCRLATVRRIRSIRPV
jgi:hypothetical protein